MIDLSIIIVNYNVKEFLLNLLESIKNASKNLSVEIIVIDNNSDDGSIEAVKAKYPAVKTIKNKENKGFGAANNQGLEIARGEYFLLINPDTLVKEDTFDKMINFMKTDSRIGLAGCKVLNPDGSLQLACRRSFPGPWVSLTKVVGLSKLFPKSRLFAKYNLTYLDENDNYEVDAVSGSFMMLTKDAYTKIGGFDTDFFMYGEDLDLCYRVQMNGMKVYYFHETSIIHYKGESTKRSKIDETKIFYDAMHLFVEKHFSSSFFIKSILQFGIIVRKLLAFINLNKYILLGIILDLISFFFLIQFSEAIYSGERWLGFPEFSKPWVYIVPSFFIVIVSALFGAYKKNSLSVMKSLLSLFAGFVIITSLTFFLKQYAFSRAVVLILFGLSAIVFSLWRIILKFTLLKSVLEEDARSNSVIIGVDDQSIALYNKLQENVSSPYKILGLIGNNFKDIGHKEGDIEVVGTTENLRKTIFENNIKNIIFPSDSLEFDKIFSIVAKFQGENINFMVSGNELDYMVGKSNIAHLENVPLLKVNYNISQTSNKIIKRAFDLILSFLLLIFYPFSFFITKVSSEVSFINDLILKSPYVFAGNKSFVGPKKIDDKSQLYLGTEGITGYWFIENIDENDFNENRRADLFYAKNQNIWLDLEIIGKSIAKHLISRRKNA